MDGLTVHGGGQPVSRAAGNGKIRQDFRFPGEKADGGQQTGILRGQQRSCAGAGGSIAGRKHHGSLTSLRGRMIDYWMPMRVQGTRPSVRSDR